MPIKLNWTRGKSFGLALIYLGIVGFLQVIIILIAQYGMKIGGNPLVVFIPIGVILATFYSIIVTFENLTSISEYRKTHKYKKGKKKKKGQKAEKLRNFVENPYVKPALIIIGLFIVIFGLTYLILFSWVEADMTFVICDNISALGCIFYTFWLERHKTRRTR